ncbi:DUF4065 domain-containing protein [Corynebacterium sp. SCR221107]|uniref:Panacea domain-containing protein n=1 Tax=Corynebacterium sp. SCR221107 TaxID=3017361 RepID=UPI0022EC7216|nr:type II toxin-antitoxin system antitoxin SocA domain-containing protein [Corynebacterium sp. SCR221107]WBT08362.1 DUF4065 domain-containing protein [Corynebacterium sp. SCR221107]
MHNGTLARILRVQDAGAYLAEGCSNPVTAWKLQQLVYFAQGFAFALTDRPIVNTTFQAWSRGPASADLYLSLDEQTIVDTVDGGIPSRIDGNNKVILDSIITTFDSFSEDKITHMVTKPGTPWDQVRSHHGLTLGADSNVEIPEDIISDYFHAILSLTDTPPTP